MSALYRLIILKAVTIRDLKSAVKIALHVEPRVYLVFLVLLSIEKRSPTFFRKRLKSSRVRILVSYILATPVPTTLLAYLCVLCIRELNEKN